MIKILAALILFFSIFFFSQKSLVFAQATCNPSSANPWTCSAGQTCGTTQGQCNCTTVEGCIGTIQAPAPIASIPGGTAEEQISTVLSNIVKIIYLVAAVIFVFMLLLSAVQWITSGGNKDAVASARGRLTWAIIGITLLALTFVILVVLEQITGFNF